MEDHLPYLIISQSKISPVKNIAPEEEFYIHVMLGSSFQ